MVMIAENIKVIVDTMEIEVSRGTSLLEISKMFENKGNKPIVAIVNDVLCELTHIPNDGDTIEILDFTNTAANRIYVNGLILLIEYAFNEIYHGKNKITVKHSVDKAICIETEKGITKEELRNIEKKMHA